jgi:hypothetical protein
VGRREWCSLAKSHNNAWRDFVRNPKGRACFSAMLRFSTLIWTTTKTPGAFLRASPEGVKHMDVLNKRASRALPRAKTGSGAATNETRTDPTFSCRMLVSLGGLAV